MVFPPQRMHCEGKLQSKVCWLFAETFSCIHLPAGTLIRDQVLSVLLLVFSIDPDRSFLLSFQSAFVLLAKVLSGLQPQLPDLQTT